MLKLPIAKLDEFFAAIAAKETLYLPVDNEGGQAQYKEWKEGVPLCRALNTVRSAKDFFFPQTENLVEFKIQGKSHRSHRFPQRSRRFRNFRRARLRCPELHHSG